MVFGRMANNMERAFTIQTTKASSNGIGMKESRFEILTSSALYLNLKRAAELNPKSNAWVCSSSTSIILEFPRSSQCESTYNAKKSTTIKATDSKVINFLILIHVLTVLLNRLLQWRRRANWPRVLPLAWQRSILRKLAKRQNEWQRQT